MALACHWVVMSDVGTRPCEVCGRPRPDDDSPRIADKKYSIGGCDNCSFKYFMKINSWIPVLCVAVGYTVVQRKYLPDAINEPLKNYIISAVFLIGLVVLGYVFFRARRRLK